MKRNDKKQFLVLGLGRFGSGVACSLSKMGYEVLAVDRNDQYVEDVTPFVTQAVQADATDEAALDAIGIHNFDVAVVSIGTNIRDSILVTVLCKEKGVPYVLAKAVDDLHAKVLRKVGADRVVFPEREMGQRVARSLVMPNILDLMELSDGFQVAEVVAPDSWCGRTLVEINVRRNYGVSVIAIHRGTQFIASPGAEEKVLPGDVMVLLGKTKDIEAINR